MTFTEAALEVLEREGRPLHAREIAERAVAWGLLSHVGKTPVQTMSARISTVVAKGPDKSPFVRVRPGVFALASWKDKPPGPKKAPPGPKKAPPEPSPSEPAQPDAAGHQAEPAPKKRKRRRRKKRSDAGEGAGTGSPPESRSEPEQKPKAEPRKPEKTEKPKESPRKQPKQQPKKQPKQKRKAVKPAATEAKAGEGAKSAKRPQIADPNDVAQRAVETLRASNAPLAPEALARAVGFKGERAILLLEALLTAEGLDRELRGLRPRFVRHRNGWALAEREVSSEIVELERQVSEAAERLSRLATRQIHRRLKGLPIKALVRVVIMYLRRQGFDSMTPLDRGGADEFHLSVLDRRGDGQFRTAVVIRRDPADKPITDRTVNELRGALHHYRAMSALIVTTGTFSDAARAEAVVTNLAPVALIDGESLARELARVSIGVRERKVALQSFDEAFFAALGT